MENRKQPYPLPEIWGGIECTINRVGDAFRDQMADAGYYDRNADMEKIASLGIRSLRFPILWERHEMYRGDEIDWTWAQKELDQMKSHGIVPIAGLVHHGSGPAFTSLYDDDFPELLAGYARKVAQRFPWIEYYTPVNEPLTTARFSGLYGHWYPHQCDTYSFLKILVNQIKAVVLSMRAIREINPYAKLVQTEDLCMIHGVEDLAYQCDFENERRWLTNDLLCGIVDDDHPLWNFFIDAGISKTELDFFLENPCPPDIAGYNYYVTSERFLDTDLAQHPPHTHGGNGKDRYADITAVHMIQPAGVKALLYEAWERYRIPLALTEVHLGCTCEEQMRWFKEIYDEACIATQEGIDVRAVTAWSLIGSYDWNSLLTRKDMHYEFGAFELKHGELHITPLGNLIRSIAIGEKYDDSFLAEKGWWHYAMQPAAQLSLS